PTARSFPTPWLWTVNVNQTTGNANYIIYQGEDILSGLATVIAGSDVSKEVIVYCGVGGYASTMYFVLSEVLGYRNVKVYDGSAQEWSHDQTLPMINEDLGSEYLGLYSNYSRLQSSYTQLSENYDALESSYKTLEQNYNSLSDRINKLESDYARLQNDYNKLRDNYDKLKSDYEELQSDYDELVKTTMPSYLTFIFVIATVIFLVVAVYLAVKLRAKKS
ncbi:MAG: rhodanese-like domain-containing protein, partial [Candidatus Bathyarchaeia archaeon]